jgi:hypothetical protein
MPMLVVQQTIGDYSKWRAGFDKAGPLRDKAGIYNARVFRDTDSPDKVLVLSETQDLPKARTVLTGPEVQKAMQEAGVIGPPKIHVIP